MPRRPRVNVGELKAARIAAHPDKPGGSHEAFIEADRRYQAATKQTATPAPVDHSRKIKRLTDAGIKALEPEAKLKRYWDPQLPGFGVAVTPTGAKTFGVMKRIAGAEHPSWRAIGRYPVMGWRPPATKQKRCCRRSIPVLTRRLRKPARFGKPNRPSTTRKRIPSPRQSNAFLPNMYRHCVVQLASIGPQHCGVISFLSAGRSC
jgi:hypothetical protein